MLGMPICRVWNRTLFYKNSVPSLSGLSSTLDTRGDTECNAHTLDGLHAGAHG